MGWVVVVARDGLRGGGGTCFEQAGCRKEIQIGIQTMNPMPTLQPTHTQPRSQSKPPHTLRQVQDRSFVRSEANSARTQRCVRAE